MAKKYKLPLFPKSAFKKNIDQAIHHWQKLIACKKKARSKGKAPSTRCLKHRSKAVRHLNEAQLIYKHYRKKQKQKNKWTGADDRLWAADVARVSALLYPKASTSLTTGAKTVTSTSTYSVSRVPSGVTAATARIGTPVLATAALPSTVESVISELPSDPFTGEAEVVAYEFEPASDADLEAGLMDEPEGIVETMKANPLLTVAAVTIVGGVAYVIYQRM